MDINQKIFDTKKNFICENSDVIIEIVDELSDLFFSSGTIFVFIPRKFIGKILKKGIRLLIDLYCQSKDLNDFKAKIDKISKDIV